MMFHVEGAGQGPDVLLVHGWGTHGGVWGDFGAGLALSARVTRVDLPGHGLSEAMPDFSLDRLADSLAQICPAPVIAIGWSLGALAVLALARRHASSVRGMVLFGATPRFVCAPDWPCAVTETLLRAFAADFERDYRATLSRFLALQLGAAHAERELLRRLRDSVLARTPSSTAGLRAGLELLVRTDLRPTLATLDVPALVVHGGRDRLTPPKAGAYLAAALPRARWHEVAQAGHAPFLSHTADCLHLTREMIHG